jgi:hypothetical protein
MVELPLEPETLRFVAAALQRAKAWEALRGVLDAWREAEPDNLQISIRQYEACCASGDEQGALACVRRMSEDSVGDTGRLIRLLRLLERAGHSTARGILVKEAHHLAPNDWRLALDYAALLEPGADRNRVLAEIFLQPVQTTVTRAAMLARLLSEDRRDDALAAMLALFGDTVPESSRTSRARSAVLEQVASAGDASLLDAVLAAYTRSGPAGLAAYLGSQHAVPFHDAILASLRRIGGDDLDTLQFELTLLRMFESGGRCAAADELTASVEPRMVAEGDPATATPTASTMMFRNRFLLDALVLVIGWLAGQRERVCVHVAACSTGEEAYSLAIALHDAGLLERCDLHASDVDSGLVRRALSGLLDVKATQSMPPGMLERHFERQPDGHFRLAHHIIDRIAFSREDLLDERFDGSPCDVLVANNVLVHFPPDERARMLACMSGRVATDGVLCIGGGRQDSLEHQLAVLGLVPILNGSADIFDAWHIQRNAWYVNPRPYWALPPARLTAATPWKHAALFARGIETAEAVERLLTAEGRQPG